METTPRLGNFLRTFLHVGNTVVRMHSIFILRKYLLEILVYNLKNNSKLTFL